MNLSRFKALVLSCVATVAFVGCGGGSDSTATATTPLVAVQTGTFVDAPVQGLKYVTLTQTGYTDENGTYKYVNGEQIEFFMGNLSLGKGLASALMTPYTMAGDTNISAPSDKAKNIAMLLQNFDANRSDSAVLDLRQLKDHNFSDVNLSATTANMESKITALLGTLGGLIDSSHPLINATMASTAMVNYITSNALKNDKKFTQAYLSGKTFYVVSHWDPEGWITLTNTFHSNGTYSYYDAPDANATVNYEVTSDGKLKITSQDPSDPIIYATIKSVTTEYIEVTEYTGNPATYKSTNSYLYFDKTKAGAKQVQLQNQELATTKKFTAEYLSGKTFYPVLFWDSWITMKDVFNSNGTWSHYDSPDGDFTELYEVTTDGRIKVTTSEVIDPVFYLTIKAVTDEYIEVTSSVPANHGYFYFEKVKADAKLAQLQP